MFTEIESFLRLVTKLDLTIVIVFLGMFFLTGLNWVLKMVGFPGGLIVKMYAFAGGFRSFWDAL